MEGIKKHSLTIILIAFFALAVLHNLGLVTPADFKFAAEGVTQICSLVALAGAIGTMNGKQGRLA